MKMQQSIKESVAPSRKKEQKYQVKVVDVKVCRLNENSKLIVSHVASKL